MRKFLLITGLLFYLIPQLMATHNRAGEIVYRKLPGNSLKYEITIITYSDSTSSAYRDSLELFIYFCDKPEALDSIFIERTAVEQIIDDVVRTEYTLESYTFPGMGCYRFAMFDPNRTDDIKNIANSVNVPFYIEDTMRILDPQFFGFNSSPVLLEHPIVFAGQYQPFRHNPGAFDPDGDSLVFSLIEPQQAQGEIVPEYKYPDDPEFTNQVPQPNEFSIDRNTGEIKWDVPHQKGKYNVAILIREFRDGRILGSIIRDMQIWVEDPTNRPPQVTDLQDTCIVAGEQLRAVLEADDPDMNDQITEFTAVGGPFAVENNPASWQTNAPKMAPANGIFNWDTDCSHVRRSKYIAVFTATDDFKDGNSNTRYSDAETWQIQVVGPAPQGLETRIDQSNKRIEVVWDSLYACDNEQYDNFVGFSVWRKRGCDSTVIDKCTPGILADQGYVRISSPEPIPDYHFYDNDATPGVVYSYRVQAEFAERVPGGEFYYNQVGSLPSDADCAQLKSDLPVITHADVRTTDESNGAVMVKWYPPDQEALDTFKNPGPYRYELFAHEGLAKGSNTTLLNTYNVEYFSNIQPDSFLHSGINTQTQPHTYSIIFYATDPTTGEYDVGETEGASTVFLETTASNKQIALNWAENVPWANYSYEVYRRHPDSTNFTLLTTTSANHYEDAGLTNRLEYCYFIRAFGSFSNDSLPDPLINNSQIVCDIPRDTVAPCQPELTVTNNCENVANIDPENFRNELSWTDPREACGDFDLAGYRIYYATTEDNELELLEEISDPNVHDFTHDNLGSLAGCYVVTAFDTFDNESSKSKKTCLDNCPVYTLPNAFTPNGDGQNDFFTPILPYYFVDHIDIKIYNRWGNLVYQTSDPDISWDGTDFRSGEPVPEGVYHYICEVYEIRVSGVEKQPEPLSGYIQLIRD